MYGEEKLRRMAEYYRDKNSERAASAFFALRNYEEAASLYSEAGDLYVEKSLHNGAQRCFSRAARSFTKLKKFTEANEMRSIASKQGEIKTRIEHTKVTDRGLSGIKEGEIKGAEIGANAKIQSAEIIAKGQRDSFE